MGSLIAGDLLVFTDTLTFTAPPSSTVYVVLSSPITMAMKLLNGDIVVIFQ